MYEFTKLSVVYDRVNEEFKLIRGEACNLSIQHLPLKEEESSTDWITSESRAAVRFSRFDGVLTVVFVSEVEDTPEEFGRKSEERLKNKQEVSKERGSE